MATDPQTATLDARRSDRLLALVMIVIATGAIVFSRDMSIMASVFPRTIAVLLLVFSVALLIKSVVAHPRRARPEAGSVARRLGLIAVMLIWSLSLKWLGFLVASVASAALLAALAHYHAWTARRLGGYAVALGLIIGGFYILFAIVLNVPLPAGLLWRHF
ncbi:MULTISPECIES: tripartite tricarboxylate transporter TctB family protein [unclassified Modicisalibacter]|uniref:tripartite tricarboxylate transporter TctB family protein n=1 Tax=unclassified Modicisalibacter TaxID=2679913 RepID=UPI001CCF9678|nr:MULTISPECIES: tripartite tricarboxylate transporter TctB family protein [unclassified Modicisalibacter]MBZ9556742.1 tripartite tricarboxylate transporter TctB family protein [Modicisalibacter sp. R2A 31.J]MBZ9574789.1 tripartite tricarboxylate transporter TctB family protein [Modicisalibacter sp. MOD 31.J]